MNGMIGYRLRLSNGFEWRLCSTDEAASWLDRFAEILELKPGTSVDKKRRIIFTRNDSEIRKEFAEHSWSSYSRYGMTFWSNVQTNDLIYVIGSEDSFEENIYNMWSCVHPIYRQVLDGGGTAFHAALVEWNGIGVLFCCTRRRR